MLQRGDLLHRRPLLHGRGHRARKLEDRASRPGHGGRVRPLRKHPVPRRRVRLSMLRWAGREDRRVPRGLGARRAPMGAARRRGDSPPQGRPSRVPAPLPQCAAHAGDRSHRVAAAGGQRARAEASPLHARRAVPSRDSCGRASPRNRGAVVRIPADAADRDSSAHAPPRPRDEGVGALEGRVGPPLIHIPDWDFHWQGFYFYRTPVALPTGSWIELMAAWDNSEQNPRNPNKPPRDVSWGEKTTDEMGHAAILFTLDNETLP